MSSCSFHNVWYRSIMTNFIQGLLNIHPYKNQLMHKKPKFSLHSGSLLDGDEVYKWRNSCLSPGSWTNKPLHSVKFTAWCATQPFAITGTYFLWKNNEIFIDNISRHVNMIQTFSHSSQVNFRKSTKKRCYSKIQRLRKEQEIQLKP